MTSEQVEVQLGEGSSGTIGLGLFGHHYTSWYNRSKLVVRYENGKVQAVDRQSP
jgi:hypothetical protein